MNGRMRRRAALVTTGTGVILAAASLAWACTTFVGTLVVKGSSSSATSTVVGINDFSVGMGYCSGNGGAVGPTSGGTVTVTVSPASTCLNSSGVNKFPANSNGKAKTYDVNIINFRTGSDGKRHSGFTRTTSGGYTLDVQGDCMSPRLSEVYNLGTIRINKNGYSLTSSGAVGSRTYNLNPSSHPGAWTKNDTVYTDGSTPPGDASGICVSDSSATYANQAPINII